MNPLIEAIWNRQPRDATASSLIVGLVLALATFLVGLYVGHRWGSHDARIEANDQKRRFQRILRFAEPYIDAHTEAQHWKIHRNAGGEIIDLYEPPIRCGTPHLLFQELLEAKRLEDARNRKDSG